MARSKGTWSEVEPRWEERVVFGKEELKLGLTKALSSRAKVGVRRLFVQVYSLSRRGISIQLRTSMVELKWVARLAWNPSVFFSVGSWVRLKSPMASQFVSGGGIIESRSSKKVMLSL